jgi:hypothetical protein
MKWHVPKGMNIRYLWVHDLRIIGLIPDILNFIASFVWNLYDYVPLSRDYKQLKFLHSNFMQLRLYLFNKLSIVQNWRQK